MDPTGAAQSVNSNAGAPSPVAKNELNAREKRVDEAHTH